MLLVNHAQPRRTLQIRINDHDLRAIVFLARLVQHRADRLTELYTACSALLRAADEEFGVLGGFDVAEDVGAFGVTNVEVGDGGFAAASQRDLSWSLGYDAECCFAERREKGEDMGSVEQGNVRQGR